MERATITFRGHIYYYDIIESYFDNEICESITFESNDPQKTFEQYIEADPSFIDLFKYDFYAID